MPNTYGAHGWPLIESKRFPGELCLSCPKCHSRNILMTVDYPVRGTGPDGRGRMGDYGTQDVLKCEDCLHTSRKLAKRLK